MKLVLSIFSGIDLLGKAFQKNGFCVVKCDDLNLDGGDIRNFKAVPNKFDGLIGGSPCQDFSRLNRNPKGYSMEMLQQYIRVVGEASPTWFTLLNPIYRHNGATKGTAVTGSDNRSFKTMCEIQGLPSNFDLPFLSLEGKKQAVANGVPLPMGNYLANLINSTLYGIDKPVEERKEFRRCGCGCGRIVTGRQNYSGPTCRKRAQRKRDKATSLVPGRSR